MRRLILGLICGALATTATAPCHAVEELTLDDLWTDTKLYFTAPVRWDVRDWTYFGGVVGAVAAAHQLDDNVRNHFAGRNPTLDGKDNHSLRDAAPAAAAVVGTWVFAELADSPGGRVEAYTMAEAAVFSSITTEGLKYAAGRKRPNETLRVDDWRASGGSFPSLHGAVAFAVGTVLAESGPDDLRWRRRIVGYGIAGLTTYLRLHDNSHWLSDLVAGGAIGVSTAVFTLRRRATPTDDVAISVSPAAGGGVALNFSWTLP
jgi:membrane-associated phospholipid phosphatase